LLIFDLFLLLFFVLGFFGLFELPASGELFAGYFAARELCKTTEKMHNIAEVIINTSCLFSIEAVAYAAYKEV
jgi:hypothetical protein